jgi:hypothetical protein
MSSQEGAGRTPRRRYWLGITFVVVVAQLLAWNLYVIVRNQALLGPDETPRPRSGNIVTLAMKNPTDVVRRALATYYYLRVIAGKTLVVPPKLPAIHLFLERVSRVHLEVARARMPLSPESCMRLQELVVRRYFLDVSKPLDVVLDDAAPRYVTASCPDGSYLAVPEAMYLRQLAGDATTQEAAR